MYKSKAFFLDVFIYFRKSQVSLNGIPHSNLIPLSGMGIYLERESVEVHACDMLISVYLYVLIYCLGAE